MRVDIFAQSCQRLRTGKLVATWDQFLCARDRCFASDLRALALAGEPFLEACRADDRVAVPGLDVPAGAALPAHQVPRQMSRAHDADMAAAHAGDFEDPLDRLSPMAFCSPPESTGSTSRWLGFARRRSQRVVLFDSRPHAAQTAALLSIGLATIGARQAALPFPASTAADENADEQEQHDDDKDELDHDAGLPCSASVTKKPPVMAGGEVCVDGGGNPESNPAAPRS
jgi:hypothetical protein